MLRKSACYLYSIVLQHIIPTRTNIYANIVKTQSSPITSSRHGGFHTLKVMSGLSSYLSCRNHALGSLLQLANIDRLSPHNTNT